MSRENTRAYFRTILSFTFGLGVFWGLIQGAKTTSPRRLEATLLYTASIQGELEHCGCKTERGGLARRAALVKEIQRTASPVFVFDLGDTTLRFPPESGRARRDAWPRARFLYGQHQAMKVDFHIPGEKDLWWGEDKLQAIREEFGIEFLAANATHLGFVTAGYKIIERGGFRLGVIGAIPSNPEQKILKTPAPGERPRESSHRLRGESPLEPIKTALGRLRQSGVHAVVFLSTLGLPEDFRIAKAIPDLDLIVGGRSRDLLRRPLRSGGVPLVQAGVQGKYLGKLRFEWENGVLSLKHEVIDLTADFPEDPQVLKDLERFKRAHPATVLDQ